MRRGFKTVSYVICAGYTLAYYVHEVFGKKGSRKKVDYLIYEIWRSVKKNKDD
jgi:hypothetical protein